MKPLLALLCALFLVGCPFKDPGEVIPEAYKQIETICAPNGGILYLKSSDIGLSLGIKSSRVEFMCTNKVGGSILSKRQLE